MIIPSDYKQLNLLAWNRGRDDPIDEDEVFELYECYWRFIDEDTLEEKERQLIDRLTKEYGNGVMNTAKGFLRLVP